jgi:hypothetical protein
LDPGDARHPAARGVLGQVVQQRRLAHARLPVHDERPALTGASSFDEAVEPFALAVSSLQLPGGSP